MPLIVILHFASQTNGFAMDKKIAKMGLMNVIVVIILHLVIFI